MEPSREINNKIILLRKSLKSILNQTKLNLAKKIKKLKASKKSTERKESELECFKRIKPTEIPLSLGLYPDRLNKTVTNANASEIDRVHARILQNPLLQKTLVSLKEKHGIERVETFLKSNEKKVKKTELKRLSSGVTQTPKSAKKRKAKEAASSDSNTDDEKEEEESTGVTPAPSSKTTAKEKPERKRAKKAESENKDSDNKPQKTLDPFFMSTSGQSYMAVINNAASDESEDEAPAKKPIKAHKKPTFASHQKKPATFSSNSRKPVKNISESQTKTAGEQDLHPSWVAKQQMKKVQIQAFKGTKIKFDD